MRRLIGGSQWLQALLHRWGRVLLGVYWPVLAVGTHWPRLQLPNPTIAIIDFDKIAHFCGFGLLGVLLIHARLAGRRRGFDRSIIVGVVVALLYAFVDELTQPLFERTVSVRDLVADLLGIAVASVGVWLWYRADGRGVSVSTGVAKTEPAQSSLEGPENPSAFVGHAVLVSVLTLGSRVMGLARDAVLAACFGMTTVTDAFWIGFVVPNLFRRMFGEGAFAAAFIPAYTRLRRDNPAVAQRLAWVCVALLVIVLGGVTVVGELILAGWLRWGAGTTETRLAVRLTMVMLPYMPMVCVVALLGGVLQVRGRFGAPAGAPILLNAVMIGATLLAGAMVQPAAGARGAILVVALSVVVAGVLQLVWLGVAAARVEPVTLNTAGTGPALRSVMLTMGPMILGLAVFQINTLLDSLIAWVLSPKPGGSATLTILGQQVAYPVQAGSVTGLQLAQRLYQFPLGVFGIALATAIFPALTRAAAGKRDDQQQPDAFRTILRQGLRLTMFIGLPASVGLIMVRLPLVRAIFEQRAFTLADSARVAAILAGYGSAVWAYAMTHVLTRACYAVNDARTPVRISVVTTVLNLSLNLSLVWYLGAAALAWSTAISAVANVVLLLWAVGRRVDRPVDRGVWGSWAKSALLAGVMAVALVVCTMGYDPVGMTRVGAGLLLVVMVGLGMGVVFGGAKLMGVQELGWLLRRRVEGEA